MMSPERFFTLFLEELKGLPELFHYYKFLSSEKDFEFRKSYFIQRLDYISRQVMAFRGSGTEQPAIWDCGCGYGTTCLYLAMNGLASYGSTLEFYFPFIEKRKQWWAAHGDSSLFTAGYEDIFDRHPKPDSVDIIIVQDTLHHLEPIDEALGVFHATLKKNGILIGIEENGSNIIQNLKLYKQRGNQRIITYWDDTLKKKITMGNENIRSLEHWTRLFAEQQLKIDADRTEFIRVLPPHVYGTKKAEEMAAKEQSWKSSLLRKYFYFGINFTARKS